MLADINKGQSDAGVTEVIYFKNAIYFGADDGIHGNELWKMNVPNSPLQAEPDVSITGLFNASASSPYPFIYPNPGLGNFSIITDDKSQNPEITIYNSLGQKLDDVEIIKSNTSLISFDMSSHCKGMYYVEFKQGDSRITKKIVKQ